MLNHFFSIQQTFIKCSLSIKAQSWIKSQGHRLADFRSCLLGTSTMGRSLRGSGFQTFFFLPWYTLGNVFSAAPNYPRHMYMDTCNCSLQLKKKKSYTKQYLSHSMRQTDIFKSTDNAGCYPLNWFHSLNTFTVVYLQLGTIAIDFCPQSGKSYVYSKTL